jgi:intersectin
MHSVSSIEITDTTSIGDILCSSLPYMADAYFQYCSCCSQANKYLQAKIELNDQFRSQLVLFQEKTGGLSLNGFLTKPIQRVTRYPLLIEKILKHTPTDHTDYRFIQQAFECARQLNERINQKISEQENNVRLDWLQQNMLLGSNETCSDGYLFDELLKFNSKTKLNTQRQLLLHGSLVKVREHYVQDSSCLISLANHLRHI